MNYISSTFAFKTIVLLHNPIAVQLQFTDGCLNIHPSFYDGRPSWSRGSKAGLNHDTATTLFHRWDKALVLGYSVWLMPNIILFIPAKKFYFALLLLSSTSLLAHPHGLDQTVGSDVLFGK